MVADCGFATLRPAAACWWEGPNEPVLARGPKKEMVPSDLNPSLAHHRHARREHRSRKRPCVSPADSAEPVFSRSTFIARLLAASFSSVRNRILVTAFRSPGLIAPLDASNPGSMFPACNSRSATCVPPARSASRLHPFGQLPDLRRLLRLLPVAGSSQIATRLAEDFHSPSGLLSPSGINAPSPSDR